MTTAYVPPTGPYEVLFSSHSSPVVAASAPLTEGSALSSFSSMVHTVIGVGIMPASGGGGSGGTQGYISFS